MKKILITLLSIAFPIHAKAQTAKQLMFSDEIEKVSKHFYPVFCRKEMPQIIDSVKDCYKNAFSSDFEMNIAACLVVDEYIIRVAKANKQRTTYSKETTNFIDQFNQRRLFYFQTFFNKISKNFDSYNQNISTLTTALSYQIHILFTIEDLYSNPDIEWIARSSSNDPKTRETLLSVLKSDLEEKKCKHGNFYYYAKDTDIP